MKPLVCAALVSSIAFAGELARVPLCATKGRIDVHGRVDEPKMRATAPGADGDRAELRFTYLGPTAQTVALGSGELRRQLGLKLRAQDGCNLIYVMWRIDPKPGIVVSVKRNPGQRTHAECGNRGYTNLRGTGGAAATLAPGSTHTLAAALSGSTLRVWADGAIAWQGEVPADALALSGPVGVRTDNARVQLELRGTRPAAPAPACSGGISDDE